VTALLVINAAPVPVLPPAVEAALSRIRTLVVVDILPSALAKRAHVLLPGTMHWEQDGTFVNVDGRVQRIRPVVAAPGEAAPAMDLLQDLFNQHPPGGSGTLSGDGVFRQLAAEIPAFRDMTYRDVGDRGLPVSSAAKAQVGP
jgi:predicted molibdopterin-dependent oxidoreductase YjgC